MENTIKQLLEENKNSKFPLKIKIKGEFSESKWVSIDAQDVLDKISSKHSYYTVVHENKYGDVRFKVKTKRKNVTDKELAEFLEIDTTNLFFDEKGMILHDETVSAGEDFEVFLHLEDAQELI